MPLTAAEKQKRYRERRKADKEREEESKRKARERYHRNKKLISNMSEREKRKTRKEWRLKKRNLRERKKILQNVVNFTPPPSPLTSNLTPSSSGSRKSKRRDRSKLFRENIKLIQENIALKRSVEKYKKRCYRAKKAGKEGKALEISPGNKTNELLKDLHGAKNCTARQKIAKQLLKYYTLTKCMRLKYQTLSKHKEKKCFKEIFENELVRKHKLLRELHNDALNSKLMYSKYKKPKVVSETVSNIVEFFKRDDVSRASAGKKETKTFRKQKIQKRYLLDTLKNLYGKFKAEGGKCSYSYFVRHKPFYIINPSINIRETCACKRHVNIEYKMSCLKKHKVTPYEDVESTVKSIVCNFSNKSCMYNECKICKDKQIQFDTNVFDMHTKVEYFQWSLKTENWEKDGKKTISKKNVREIVESDIKNLIKDFQSDIIMHKTHIFNIRTQYIAYRTCIDNLETHEVAIHIDFSENYSCKLAVEIQGHHFGSSRKQITLHTGKMWT